MESKEKRVKNQTVSMAAYLTYQPNHAYPSNPY